MSTPDSRPARNPWMITFVVSLAAFMEVLDTSIANVALPHIGGSLGATTDETTWVLTSYIAANAVVLPISGWLAGAFGRKRFFMTCIALFGVSSFLCGIAPNLLSLLLFRVLQGAGGGGLQPMAQAILVDTFPPERRGMAFSLYGVTAVTAPIVGPTLGGWIVDNESWRWIFLINVPVVLLALLLVLQLVEDPPYIARLRNAGVRLDAIGFALLVLGVGALQVMLDKGQQEDWFASRLITILAITAVVCLTALAIREWSYERPIIDLRLLRNFNFLSANVMILMLGMIYFSSLVMMPRYLQELLGYTAQKAGLVLSSSAVVLLVMLPIVGKISNRVPARILIAAGWAAVAVSMAISARWLNLGIEFRAARDLRLLQSAGLPLLFVPITLAAYVGLPPEKNNSAAGLLNFMRNIGSSIGTSLVTTILAWRTAFHQTYLVGHAAPDNPTFRALLEALSGGLARAGLGAYEAQRQALARIYAMVQAQAASLAYVDVFWLLAAGSALMFALSFLLRKNDPRAAGPVAA